MKNTLIYTMLLLSSVAFGVRETRPLTVGEWSYGYERCKNGGYGFLDVSSAEEAGMQKYYPDGCWPTSKDGEIPFPPENYPHRESRPACYSGPLYPVYGTGGLAKMNHKQVTFKFWRTVGDECRSYTDSFSVRKYRFIGCEDGWFPVANAAGGVHCEKVYDPENDGNQCPGPNQGNPINTATGNKFHEEPIDLFSDQIDLRLYYNSRRAIQNSNANVSWMLGKGWRHSFGSTVSSSSLPNGSTEEVFYHHGSGRSVKFTKTNGTWTNQSGNKESLTQLADGWAVSHKNGSIEKYNFQGRLVSINNNGMLTTVEWEPLKNAPRNRNGRLKSITTAYGRKITVSRTSSVLFDDTFTDDLGNEWKLIYNSGHMLEKIIYPDLTEKTFHYESDKSPYLLTGITDRRGIRFSTYQYDNQRRVVYEKHHAKDENGNDLNVEELSIVYHANNTRTITNSRGNISTYEVEQNNGLWQLKSITGPGCSSCSNDNTSFQYDSNNNLISKTQDGVTTKYFNHDNKGQYAYKIQAFGTPEAKRTDYHYDPRFINKITQIKQASVVNGQHKITTYSYNDNAQVTSMTEQGYRPDGTAISRTTTYEYNGPFSQISRIDGPLPGSGDQTTYQYYSVTDPTPANRNRLKSVTAPGGIVERNNITWSPTGKVIQEQRPNGITLTNSYHPNTDRLVSSTKTDGSTAITTQLSYLPTGHIQAITENHGTPTATTLTLHYDDALRLIRVTDQTGNFIKYTLDTEGNLTAEKVHDPSGNLKKIITKTYDSYDQLATTTQSNTTVSYNYASNGVLDDQTNGNNIKTTYQYDNLKRLTQVSQDDGGNHPQTANTQTTFSYDTADRIASVTDAKNHTTTYSYDDFDRLVSLNSPDTGTTTYQHDLNGNTTQKTDANGITTHMSYDLNSRLTATTYPDNSLNSSYHYDQGTNGIGHLTSFSNSTDTTTLSHNAFGQLLTKTQNITGFNAQSQQAFNDLTISHSYDSSNRLSSTTYPSGIRINYSYDATNRIKAITALINGQTTTLINQVNYLPFGPITAIQYGNGQNYQATYDNGYRLQHFSYGKTIAADYSYDHNHNITAITREQSLNNQAYGYDRLDRLTNENTGPTTYRYDKLGNRIAYQYGKQPTITTNIDPNSNRIINIGNAPNRSYDANGNTLSTAEPQTQVWQYNQANRMTLFKQNNIIRGRYRYNAIGQRVHKTQYKPNGGLAGDFLFLYNDQDQLIHTSKYKNGRHTWDRETVWLANRPIARIETRYSGNQISTQNIYYIQTDHLDTPRWVTDQTGTQVWSWESNAFGTTTPNTDPDGNGSHFYFRMRFPGQYYDAESKTYYNYYRDYEPATGRYLQSDPIGLGGGMNTYEYVNSSPIRLTDSTGLRPMDDFSICFSKDECHSNFLIYNTSRCKSEQVEGCCKSYNQCVNTCFNTMNSFSSIPVVSVMVSTTPTLYDKCKPNNKIMPRMGAVSGGWTGGAIIGCSMVCLTNSCSY